MAFSVLYSATTQIYKGQLGFHCLDKGSRLTMNILYTRPKITYLSEGLARGAEDRLGWMETFRDE